MSDAVRRWVVHGRVQGVSFRWFTQQEATRLGLSGWVRNREDGTVEVLAAGRESSLKALGEQLGRGPRWARVDRLEEESLPRSEAPETAGFEIRH